MILERLGRHRQGQLRPGRVERAVLAALRRRRLQRRDHGPRRGRQDLPRHRPWPYRHPPPLQRRLRALRPAPQAPPGHVGGEDAAHAVDSLSVSASRDDHRPGAERSEGRQIGGEAAHLLGVVEVHEGVPSPPCPTRMLRGGRARRWDVKRISGRVTDGSTIWRIRTLSASDPSRRSVRRSRRLDRSRGRRGQPSGGECNQEAR